MLPTDTVNGDVRITVTVADANLYLRHRRHNRRRKPFIRRSRTSGTMFSKRITSAPG